MYRGGKGKGKKGGKSKGYSKGGTQAYGRRPAPSPKSSSDRGRSASPLSRPRRRSGSSRRSLSRRRSTSRGRSGSPRRRSPPRTEKPRPPSPLPPVEQELLDRAAVYDRVPSKLCRHPIAPGERQVPDLEICYPSLPLTGDVSACHFPEFNAATSPTRLPSHRQLVSLEPSPVAVFDDNGTPDDGGVSHRVAVMLLEVDPSQPVLQGVNVLVGSREGQLLPVGGGWHAALDGGDPYDDATMERTARRCVKGFCGADLESVPLLKVTDVRYASPKLQSTERTVIFLAQPWSLDPPQKEVLVHNQRHLQPESPPLTPEKKPSTTVRPSTPSVEAALPTAETAAAMDTVLMDIDPEDIMVLNKEDAMDTEENAPKDKDEENPEAAAESPDLVLSQDVMSSKVHDGDDGVPLTEAGFRDKYAQMMVKSLRTICKEKGLSQAGKKQEMVERLVEHDLKIQKEKGADQGTPSKGETSASPADPAAPVTAQGDEEKAPSEAEATPAPQDAGPPEPEDEVPEQSGDVIAAPPIAPLRPPVNMVTKSLFVLLANQSTEKPLFELSLFAEALYERLYLSHGLVIHTALREFAERQKLGPSRKRPRDAQGEEPVKRPRPVVVPKVESRDVKNEAPEEVDDLKAALRAALRASVTEAQQEAAQQEATTKVEEPTNIKTEPEADDTTAPEEPSKLAEGETPMGTDDATGGEAAEVSQTEKDGKLPLETPTDAADAMGTEGETQDEEGGEGDKSKTLGVVDEAVRPGSPTADNSADVKAEDSDVQGAHENSVERPGSPLEEQAQGLDDPEKPSQIEPCYNEDYLKSFRFLDTRDAGVVRCADLEAVLHALHMGVTPAQAHALAHPTELARKHGVCDYMEVCDLSA